MHELIVFASGNGSNLQTIIDAIAMDKLQANIQLVITDRPCHSEKRAEVAGIPYLRMERKSFAQEINKVIANRGIDYIILAGFLSILPAKFTEKWDKKIINIHPSLLPKYGGKGMYGMRVHEMVIDKQEKISGCTVHFVDGSVDTGEIILQKVIEIDPNDTAEKLQQKVLEQEHIAIIEVLQILLKY